MRSFSAGFEYDQSMYVRAFVTQVHGRFIVKVGRMTSSGATSSLRKPVGFEEGSGRCACEGFEQLNAEKRTVDLAEVCGEVCSV